MIVKSRSAALAAIVIALSFAAASGADAFPRGGHARAHGSRSREISVTGQHGRTRSVETTQSWNRRTGVYNRDRTTTFNNGSQRTVDVDRTRTAPGEYSVSREVTGRNGDTRTQTGAFSVDRAANGRSVTGDISTSNHGEIDYARSVSHDDGVRSVNSSATFEDGSTITRSSSGSCANGVCTSSGVVTGRHGNETSWDQTRTRTETGATASRDVTFADGSTRAVDRERDGNGDGTGTITRSVTGRNGKTRTQTGDYVVTRNP